MNYGRLTAVTLNVLDKSWRILVTAIMVPGILVYVVLGLAVQILEGFIGLVMDGLWRA